MEPDRRTQIEQLAKEMESLIDRSDDGASADAVIVFGSEAYNPFIEQLRRYRTLAPALRATEDDERTPLESGVELILESAMRARRTMAEEVERVPLQRPDARHSVYYRLAEAKAYIDLHYERDITVEYLAEVACVSQYHFLRLFRSVFEVTPYRYLLLRRLSKAAELLRNSDTPIGDIAIRVGFENLPVFSDAFRKEYGVPPSKYRKNPPASVSNDNEMVGK
ncbi:MAG: helix-turn-helix transcriptional regulator [Bacteroidetes bacterium]|nr:helix-turn-helix transcriptional regulator [Bacteroidota bacterium]